MKLVKLYETVLREDNAQACVARFGDVLFADQLGGNEKNTDIENKHAKAVHAFTDFDFGENLKPEMKQAIDDLQSCIKTYPEVLKPEVEKVYRGTSAPIMWFIKNGMLPTKDVPQIYEYKANSPIQSWTDAFDKAKIFGEAEDLNQFCRYWDIDDISFEWLIPEINKFTIPVILEHKASDKDFLFKSKYLNKMSEFEGENEVIRVENYPITVMAHLNNKWLSSESERLLNIINDKL
jgi:hypothetical protein